MWLWRPTVRLRSPTPFAPVAQSAEHLPFKQGVGGSNPPWSTKRKRPPVGWSFPFDVYSRKGGFETSSDGARAKRTAASKRRAGGTPRQREENPPWSTIVVADFVSFATTIFIVFAHSLRRSSSQNRTRSAEVRFCSAQIGSKSLNRLHQKEKDRPMGWSFCFFKPAHSVPPFRRILRPKKGGNMHD